MTVQSKVNCITTMSTFWREENKFISTEASTEMSWNIKLHRLHHYKGDYTSESNLISSHVLVVGRNEQLSICLSIHSMVSAFGDDSDCLDSFFLFFATYFATLCAKIRELMSLLKMKF